MYVYNMSKFQKIIHETEQKKRFENQLKQNGNVSLQHWLQIRHTIQTMKESNSAMISTMNDVINLYGGAEKVLELIVNHSNVRNCANCKQNL